MNPALGRSCLSCVCERRSAPPAGRTKPNKRVPSSQRFKPGGPRAPESPADGEERLAKVLAHAGVAARRACSVLIQDGKVSVNGETITAPGHRVLAARDVIEVDGKRLVAPKPHLVYLAVNKPKGYVCSNVGTKRAVDLVQPWLQQWAEANVKEEGALPPRLYPVGRLDVPTTGLLLMTNDGAWAHRVMHPSSELTKEYVATLATRPKPPQLAAVAAGAVVEGVLVVPKAVEAVEGVEGRPRLRLVVSEGRKHEVRVLVAEAGLELLALKRTRIGGLRLPRSLGLGGFVELTPKQVELVLREPGEESD